MLPFPVDRRSPLRRAVEDGDTADVIQAVRAHVELDDRGCWIWQRRTDREGYAKVTVAGRTRMVHRLVMGDPAGPVVHHVCATRNCVNPEHLQLVTHRENNAEMLERNHYLARIAELEAALAELQPDHPAL